MSRVGRATLVVAVCAAWALAAPAAFAVCAAASEESHFSEATVVFEGVAQPGATVNGTSLVSPATFVVERYLKGDGPSQVEVTTGTGLDDGPVPGAPQDPSLAVPLLLGAVAITVGAMLLSRRRRHGHAPPNVR
jgi:hypothetical protein